MSKLDQKKFSDLLELITVLAFFFLIFVIYAPVSVWSEEQEFEKQSRFNMKNIYIATTTTILSTKTFEFVEYTKKLDAMTEGSRKL